MYTGLLYSQKMQPRISVCFFGLNQRILIKLMALMLPSHTNCNSTYVIYFNVYFYDTHVRHSIHFPHFHSLSSNPSTLHIVARFYLFFFPQI